MKWILILLGAVLFLLIANLVLACEFDTDCYPGSHCLKQSGQLYGVCYGGIEPGNRNDREPVYDPLDPNGTTGNTCDFDTDCGPGAKCVKDGYAVQGVCMRVR